MPGRVRTNDGEGEADIMEFVEQLAEEDDACGSSTAESSQLVQLRRTIPDVQQSPPLGVL